MFHRVPFVRDGLITNESSQRHNEPLKNKQILDIGCGGGILSEVRTQNVKNVLF